MKAIRTYSLSIEHHDEDGGYLASFPALPGCQTWGTTFESAIKNAEEALAVYVESRVAHGDELPEETDPQKPITLAVMVSLPAAA